MTSHWTSGIFLIACLVHALTAQGSDTHSAGSPRGRNGAPVGPQTAPAGLSASDIQLILDSHNEARKSENAVLMPDLVWADNLALKAQNWTDACVFAHQSPRARKWGENIAAVGNTRSKAGQMAAMIGEWVAEKQNNKGGTFEECCSFRANTCCQYTQIIWSTTHKVGCGYTACDSLEYGNGALNNVAFLACYYTPSGNRPKVTYDWRPYEPKETTFPPA